MKFIKQHKEFFYSCLAVFVGASLGFVGARFINEKLSNHAFYNCDEGHLMFFEDALVGGRYICFKK